MPFDLEGARKEGYSDSEIAGHLASEHKFDLRAAKQEGYSDAEVISHLASAATPKLQTGLLANAKGPAEAAAVIGAGTVGSALGGLAGMAQGAYNVLGEQTGLYQPGMPAGDRVRQVQDAVSIQPKTQAGNAIARTVAYPFEKLAQGGDAAGAATTDATGSPALGAAVNTAIQSAPMALTGALKGPVSRGYANAETRAADLKSIRSVEDATLNTARELGYKFPKSELDPSFLGNKVESVGGKAALGQAMNRSNQVVTDAVGRREAGLAANEPLSLQTLEKARNKLAEPYRELRRVSQDAALALEDLQGVRLKAKEQWDYYFKNGDPAIKAKAQEFNAEAKRLEGVIDTEATNAGIPGLPQRVKEARTALAKNYDVERALNVGNGHLDARIWGRMLDHEKPLSGELKSAAAAAEAMGRYMKEVSAVPAAGVSKLHMPASALLGFAGHAALGPMGLLAAALPFLDGPARALAMSKAMQGPRAYGPGAGISGLETLTSTPEAMAIAPATGGLERLLKK